MVVGLLRQRTLRRLTGVVGAAAVLTCAATPAQAALTASLTSVSLAGLIYSHQPQTSSGTATLTAADDTGTNLGWSVTVQSSNLAYTGVSGGTAIPAANLSLSAADAPVMSTGQAVDAAGGPRVPDVSPVGTLDVPRKLLQAAAGYGNGAYTQQVGLSLTVPGTSAEGSYTATLTTTISTGP